MESGNMPIFSFYIALCTLIWISSGLSYKDSVNSTSLIVLLSAFEPLLYFYLLFTAIFLGDNLPMILFSFLIVARSLLQAFFVSIRLQNLTFFEIEEDLRRFRVLKFLEYAYNFKLALLRDAKLFGLRSLSLSILSRKKVYENLSCFLKCSLIIDTVVALGFVSYYITCGIDQQVARLTYIESTIFTGIHLVLTFSQILKIKKELNNKTEDPHQEANKTENLSAQYLNKSQLVQNSSKSKLYECHERKTDLDKSGELGNNIIAEQGQDPCMLIIDEISKEDFKQKCGNMINLDDSWPTFQRKHSGPFSWEAEGSVVIEPQIKNELEWFKGAYTDRDTEKDREERKNMMMSLKSSFKAMSEKITKTLANLSPSMEKSGATGQIVENISSFEANALNSNATRNKTSTDRKINSVTIRPKGSFSQSNSQFEHQVQGRWWPFAKEASFSLIGLHPNSCSIDGVMQHLQDNSHQVARKTLKSRNNFRRSGGVILHKTVKERARKESQEVDEVVIQ